MNLLETINSQTMSSREIAKLTGKQHPHIVRDIKIMLDKIHPNLDDIDSKVIFAKYKVLNNREVIDCFDLPKRETLILISGYNAQLRAKIIDRWMELEQKELQKQKSLISRSEARLEYRPMTDAIKEAHDEIKPYHFSNEADLINRIVLGMTASKFRSYNDFGKNDSIRDYLTKLQLDCIVALQRANTVYIEDGLSFDERKKKLNSLFDRKFKDKLIEETHLITA